MKSDSLVLYYSLGGQSDNILLTQGEKDVERADTQLLFQESHGSCQTLTSVYRNSHPHLPGPCHTAAGLVSTLAHQGHLLSIIVLLRAAPGTHNDRVYFINIRGAI